VLLIEKLQTEKSSTPVYRKIARKLTLFRATKLLA
jgi:hypothetical protein